MENIEFEKFKDDCVEDLSELQEEFKNLYQLESYPNWYYDHGLGVFTFKSESKNLYFKYVDVGSYSNNTNTWKWSWDNEHKPDRVKKGMGKTKEFGEGNNFTQLTTGLIDGDEYTGWEMTAITSKLLNGLGAYKVPQDHLDIYFVFINELEQSLFNELKEKYVECGEHGSRRRALVCQHLKHNIKTGFEEAFPTYPDMEFEYEDDDLQAWCDECEKVREANDGWNEESEKFAKIKLICEKCYFEIKEFNLGYKEG